VRPSILTPAEAFVKLGEVTAVLRCALAAADAYACAPESVLDSLKFLEPYFPCSSGSSTCQCSQHDSELLHESPIAKSDCSQWSTFEYTLSEGGDALCNNSNASVLRFVSNSSEHQDLVCQVLMPCGHQCLVATLRARERSLQI